MAKAAILSFKTKSPSLNEAKKAIDALDLTLIIERVMKEKKWTRRMASIVERYYRNFLYMRKKYEDQYNFPPPLQVDEIWHAHILFTKKYHDDCQKIFGEYLHHLPTHHEEEFKESQNVFAIYLDLHEKEFGYPVYHVSYSLADIFPFFSKPTH